MNAFVRPAKNTFVAIDEVDISHTIRPYNAAVVAELAQSIRAIGLQTPLTCVVRDDKHILVAGRNRFEALRVIGCEQAPVRVVDFDDTEAQLWRLSENLHRAELTKLEYDRHVVQYAELLKAKQTGEVAASGPDDQLRQLGAIEPAERWREDGQSSRSGPSESKRPDGRGHRPESGYRQASRELNIPEQTVRRAYQTASLSPEAQEAAVETGLDDNRRALLEAAKERTPEAQTATIRRIAERKAPSAEPTTPAPSAKPLRNLDGLAAYEFVRWIRATTPNDQPRISSMLRMSADILEGKLEAAETEGREEVEP